MNITEAITTRRSVRTYTGESLDEATTRRIAEYIVTLKAPFGAGCRIEIVRTAASAEPVRLGTYGNLRGAVDYLALITRGDDPMTAEGSAYAFEQAILHCTAMGLGTCWVVGFFDRGGFKKHLRLAPGEKLIAISPVGHTADKPHFSLATLVTHNKPMPRKPFSELFFDGTFGTPLTEAKAGVWAFPLEMVRRAPSANNKQPWRVVVGRDEDAADVLHFYVASPNAYTGLDAGISLCHFAETCREKGIAGKFTALSDAPAAPKTGYVTSWVVSNITK